MKVWLAVVLMFVITPFVTITNTARAACTQQGCVLAGPRLATIDSTQGALLNALLGSLTGSSVNLTLLDWQNLAGGNVNVAQMISGLQTQLNVSTPSQALTTNASLLQIINAAAGATVGGNAAVVSGSLNNIGSPLSVGVGGVYLGDLLQVSGAAGQTTINALDLVTGAVQLYNSKNVATTNAPVTVSVPGLTGINNLTLAAQVVEPPVYTCGPNGSTFHSAAIRLKLGITLPTQSPLVGVLNGIIGVTNSSVTLGSSLNLYVEVARANGTLGSINAITQTFSANVTPGVADLYIGTISDSVFFNRSVTLSQSSFTPAPFGTLSLTALGINLVTGNIGIKAYAHGTPTSGATNMNFSPPYPQTQTATSGSSFATNLVTTLLNNLQVTISLSLLPILNLDVSIGNLVAPLVTNLLSPVLNVVTTTVLDPVLNLLGVKLGQAVVTAYGTYSVCNVTGLAYSDVNHNAMYDTSESGTGLTLYAKLIRSDDPTRTLQVSTVTPATGAYSFANVASSDYSVMIDTSNTTTDVTATTPAGWFPTEQPTQVRTMTVVNVDVPNQNFGFFNGSKLTGRVFNDNGVGSGSIANNVIREVNEVALAGVPVRVTNSADSTIYDSTNTLADGVYTLWIPAAAGATSLKITETNIASYVSTGGAVGNTSGTYDRTSDTITFTHVIGSSYANVNFGDVLANQFNTDGRQSILPGTVAFYPHTFVSGTSGTVTFSGTAPAVAGWTNKLYTDANCDGAINGVDAPITGGLAVSANQNVCILVRVFASDTAAYNEQYPLTLSASFAFANSALVDALSRNDLTVVGDAGEAGLLLTKAVNLTTALPGQVLVYTITYTNRSTGPLTTLKIYDTTPDYTVFTSAACGTLAAGLSGCTVSTVPVVGAVGAIQWTLNGNLLPGGTGTVTFQVTIQ